MDNKKIAAATSAVFTYIKTQEEAAYYASLASEQNEAMPAESIENERTGKFSPWANAGRLNQMQQNTMLLMKVR